MFCDTNQIFKSDGNQSNTFNQAFGACERKPALNLRAEKMNCDEQLCCDPNFPFVSFNFTTGQTLSSVLMIGA